MATENVSELLQTNWGIRPKELSPIREGDSTNNWRVVSDNGEQYVFRNAGIYQYYVRFQCDVLGFLKEKKFPYAIPELVRLQNGNFIINTETGSFFLYKYIDGDIVKSVSLSNSQEIGVMLATYHKYVSTFEWAGYKQLRSKDLFDQEKMRAFIATSKESVENKVEKTNVDKKYLLKVDSLTDFYLSTTSTIDLSFYHSLAKIPCHGDLEKGNIIKRRGSVVGFIDLGGITIDPAICDLQSSIQLNCLRNGQVDYKLANGVLHGYAKHVEIKDKELELVAPLMYSEMLKTLCWVLFERSRKGSRIDEHEASKRLVALDWIVANYPRVF